MERRVKEEDVSIGREEFEEGIGSRSRKRKK